MAAMRPVRFSAGERFITQGDEGDSLYVIQTGSCYVSLEKNRVLYPIAVMGPGDIVGEMAILTGEIRNAHVDAQTDIEALRLSRWDFDEICEEFPEVRQFLTQTVTMRFARSTVTADRTIGKYVIQDIIGRGGWSVVYKGIHTNLNMPVAVKMLKHNMAMDSSFLNGFLNEARIIAHLNHENIVKVYDIEQLYRTVFIIMEHLEGASLEVILKSQKIFAPARALHVILQVCAGLAYAHDKGIIHRDLKPGNIFVQNNGRAKLLDFGLACSPGTKGDRVVGTPKYLSPEQIKGEPVDERSDVYSLGMTSFRMITGKEAFPETDLSMLLQMQLFKELPDPRQFVPDLPEELRNFLMKATRKEPADRYQNMTAIIHELQPLAHRLGMEVVPPGGRCLNLMSLFLFYRDEHKDILKRLIEDFSAEVAKTGVILRETDFKDV
jgi:serine/threonine protein kinase